MSARDRNFGIAVRERDRRIARGLEDPYDTTAQGGDVAGDAFWGSLRELGQRASDAGMGFRADLSGIGRFAEAPQGGGRLTDTDRAGIAGNVALGRYADESGANAAMRNAYASQRTQQIADELKQADTERQVNEAFADPNASRDAVMAKLPPPLRPVFAAQWAQQDLAAGKQQLEEAKVSETERHNRALESVPKDTKLVQVMGPQGTPIWVRESEAAGKPAAQAPRAVTGAERQALSFFNRAQDAVKTLTEGDTNSLEHRMAAQNLAGQAQLGYQGPGANLIQTAEQQQYRQAQRAFTEARLRKESGAAIPESEFRNDAKTYFVQPGDDAKTVEQKRASRQKVLDGLAFSAGKAYDEFYGEPRPNPNEKSGTVTLIAPNGSEKEVPADQVEHYLGLGAKRKG